jgi:MFS family permease
MLASPLGVVAGFLLTSIMNAHETWHWSFYIQAACIFVCFVGFLLTPSKYLDVEGTVANRAKCTKLVQQKLYKSLNADKIRKSSTAPIELEQERRGSERGSIASSFRGRERSMTQKQQDFQDFLVSMDDDIFAHQDSIPKNRQNVNLVREKALSKIEKLIKQETQEIRKNSIARESVKKESLKHKLKSIATNKVFLLLLSTLCGLYFVVTGIQYWTPDYMKIVLGAPPEVVTIYFSVTTLTGPVLGVVVGGILTTYLGGYSTVKAQKMQCYIGCVSVLSGLPMPYINNLWLFGALLWVLLFCGGFILP